MHIYYDDFGNKATIKEVLTLPYKGATQKEKGYKLTCYAIYDNNEIYFLSIYEYEAQALEKLSHMSSGTFKFTRIK